MRIAEKHESACTNAIGAWLSEVRGYMLSGRVIELDPFYERTLTPDIVQCVLQAIVDKVNHEIQYAGSSHATWQTDRVPGAPQLKISDLRAPRYFELPYEQQLAIVQGIDRACQPFRATEEDIAEEDHKAWLAAESARQYAAQRAANLARDPHFYDDEWAGYC